jgi:hypothetical protein
VTTQHHEGNALGEVLQPCGVDGSGDGQDAVHLTISQHLDRLWPTVVMRACGSDDELVPGALERTGSAADDLGEERVLDRGDLDAERVGGSPHRARRHTGPVAQLFDRGLDLGLHLAAHAVGIPDDLGDRRTRNASGSRHILDRDRVLRRDHR